MASINFSSGTTITSTWLNDVDAVVWDVFNGVSTVAGATARLSSFVGDSGSGGTKGMVPAPSAGDAAASKFLKADGTWSTAAAGGDFSSNTSTSIDSEIVLFSGTGGKTGKRATTTGILKGTSGILSAASVGDADLILPTQTSHSGKYLTTNGTTSSWSTVAAATLPQNYITGLTLSNNATDATNDIDIAIGSARDSTNAADIVLASALVKRLDAAWAVGTNQGGLDTGSIANGTYHVWLIQRSDTGVEDVLFSTSATAPTMPTNYDYKRRIGSILRESAAIVPFFQYGHEFRRKTLINDVNNVPNAAYGITRTLSVPTGIKVRAIVSYGIVQGIAGLAAYSLLTSLDETDSAASATLFTCNIGDYAPTDGATCKGSSSNLMIVTNTSGQIRSRMSVAAVYNTEYITTLGWEDYRLLEGA